VRLLHLGKVQTVAVGILNVCEEQLAVVDDVAEKDDAGLRRWPPVVS
jgi:hypothetical protein